MANIHYSAYGATCEACVTSGRTWLTPDGDRIRLCAEHEVLVADDPHWGFFDDLRPR